MKIIRKRKYISVTLPKNCSADISVERHKEIAILLGYSENILINGIEVVEFDDSWTEIIILLLHKVEGQGKTLRLVNFLVQLEEILKNSSVKYNQLFSVGIVEALQDFKANIGQAHKSSFLKEFIQAVPRVLYLQSQLLCKQQRISIKKGELGLLPGDIIGIINIYVSLEEYYSVMLCFPRATFLKLLSHKAGTDFTEVNQEVQDRAVELLGIIYGQVRLHLADYSPNLKASIPTILSVNTISSLDFEKAGIVPVAGGKMITIPFESRFGNFSIEAWFPASFTGRFLS